MEILFVTHKYPPSIGGMEKQSYELIQGMSRYARVHTIVYEGGGRLKFFASLNRRILAALKENPGISVVHFNDGLIAAVSLMHTGYAHLKRCVTMHGLDVVFPGWIYQRLILPRFNRFDLIIAVSCATAEACALRGISKEKVVVINNGVETSEKQRVQRPEMEAWLSSKYAIDARGKQVFLAMGRAVKRKGFSWFLQNVVPGLDKDVLVLLISPGTGKTATDRLMAVLPGFIRTRLELFLGYPGDDRVIEKLLKGSALSKKVYRLQSLPGADIDTIFAGADAFVMPNIEVEGDMEGFGLVCLEACMYGLPVFAAASGGITDAIIPGKNGVLVPPGNAEIWMEELNNFALGPADKTALAGSIVSFTRERFSWEVMVHNYFVFLSKFAR
ncbi:glycosyltransferase family 4 protein [Pedobacter deserti]|uniref:glycosyltransferase family 4 protein n=1 Tax=Pedobacter deserti TaxID=2817382 RepID=UPI00210C21FB|nr:glycosyltransferase family 4 protein [Pedobacter sp. SYSU D00382]